MAYNKKEREITKLDLIGKEVMFIENTFDNDTFYSFYSKDQDEIIIRKEIITEKLWHEELSNNNIQTLLCEMETFRKKGKYHYGD